MSLGTVLIILIWGFVLLVTITCGITMYYADELEKWGKESIQPWLNERGLLGLMRRFSR